MPLHKSSLHALFLALALLPLAAGCPGSSGSNKPAENHGHNDHAHSHDTGPAGGHIIELGDEQYHVEWLHDDEEGRLTFIVRDGDVKEEVPIDADHLTVELTVKNDQGEDVSQEIEIPAIGRTDEKPQTARFELVDKAAIVSIVGGKDVKVMLHVPIGEEDFSAEIKHDAHHGHSHSH